MKLLFFNHNSNGEVAQAGNAIKGVVSELNFAALQGEWPDVFYKDEGISVCVFHGIPDQFSFDDLAQKADWSKPGGMIVCLISTAPLSKEISAIVSGKTKHWRVTVPNARAVGLIGGEQSQLSKNWKEFLDALLAGMVNDSAPRTEEITNELGRFLNPDYSEPILAFRLLCEAKLFCGDSPTREMNGITINAPMTIQDWLSPFGKANEGDIDYVASIIGNKNTQHPAKAVLHAMVGKGDLNQSIRDFLDLLSKVEKV